MSFKWLNEKILDGKLDCEGLFKRKIRNWIAKLWKRKIDSEINIRVENGRIFKNATVITI
jgi:hypothetical protein